MSQEKLWDNLKDLGDGIEACLEKRTRTAALVLIYSAIDITAWLDSDDPDRENRDSFTSWADKYLAKRLCYAWGSAGPGKLQELIARCKLETEFTAVHVEGLYQAWLKGLSAWHEELHGDPARAGRVYSRAGTFFGQISLEDVGNMLQIIPPP